MPHDEALPLAPDGVSPPSADHPSPATGPPSDTIETELAALEAILPTERPHPDVADRSRVR